MAIMDAVTVLDEAAFSTTVERHRRELLVHCYRMLGSYTQAEDLVQETFLRAWAARDRFEGRSSVRTWLYRIATNACLDAAQHSSRRSVPTDFGRVPAEDESFQPCPDAVLDPPAGARDEPDAAAVTRETIELTFIAALRHLPPRQRVVLIVRDVLGWTAEETAELLEVSVASANSLLQRARARLQRTAPSARMEWSRRHLSADEDAVLQLYVRAHEAADAEALIALVQADTRITMPPEPPCIGAAEAFAFFRHILGPDGCGEWRLVPTRANRQPAVACYLRAPGDDTFRAKSIDLLRVVDRHLVEVNCFLGDGLFSSFGLPLTLP